MFALDAYEVDEANVCIDEIDAVPVVWVDSFPSDVTKIKLMAAFKSSGALLFCMQQYNIAHMTFCYAVTRVPALTISKWSIKIGEFKFQIECGCLAFHTRYC